MHMNAINILLHILQEAYFVKHYSPWGYEDPLSSSLLTPVIDPRFYKSNPPPHTHTPPICGTGPMQMHAAVTTALRGGSSD